LTDAVKNAMTFFDFFFLMLEVVSQLKLVYVGTFISGRCETRRECQDKFIYKRLKYGCCFQQCHKGWSAVAEIFLYELNYTYLCEVFKIVRAQQLSKL